MAYTMSPEALAQRRGNARKAGQALAQKVGRNYYRVIGQRGQREWYRRHVLLWLADNWTAPQELIKEMKLNPAQIENLTCQMRDWYRQEAEAWQMENPGQHFFVDFFQPGFDELGRLRTFRFRYRQSAPKPKMKSKKRGN